MYIGWTGLVYSRTAYNMSIIQIHINSWLNVNVIILKKNLN